MMSKIRIRVGGHPSGNQPLRVTWLRCLIPGTASSAHTRYRAYQARLAAQPIGDTFIQAVAFLRLAAESGTLSRT